MVDFGIKVRIKFNKGLSRVYDAGSIRIESSSVKTPTAKIIMQFWNDVAKYTSVRDEQQDRGTFLKQQFDKLTFVSPSSVLGCYLNGDPVRVNPQTGSDTIFPFKFNVLAPEVSRLLGGEMNGVFFLLVLYHQ